MTYIDIRVMPTIVLLMMENVIDDHDDMTVVTTL
jgi:hypothetical protein